jgi:hypothetical protein
MSYEKPEVRDFGSIAEHTYWGGGFWKDCFNGGSPNGKFGGWSGHSGGRIKYGAWRW